MSSDTSRAPTRLPATRSLDAKAPRRAPLGDSTAPRPGARRLHRKRAAAGLLYILPAAVVYLGFTVWPALNTVYLSFLDWDGILPPTWVGLANYAEVFTDPLLSSSIVHALVLIIFFSFVPIVVGLALTGLLMGKIKKGVTVFRVIFFLPYVLPLVAVGTTWRWMYNQDGLVNVLLGAVGLGDYTRAWLGDTGLALIALGLIGSWSLSGLCMMLFLAGAQKIDTGLYEAATLDGAGPLRQFTAVTLPGLRGEVTVAAVITTIAALASFDLVYVTTNGGPVNSTTVPGLLVYRLAFTESEIGTASALAVVLTALVIALVSAIRFVASRVDS